MQPSTGRCCACGPAPAHTLRGRSSPSHGPANRLTIQNPPAVSTIAGPAGMSTLNEISKPSSDAAMASATAILTCPASEADQCRAAIAGSIIRPTDISVPECLEAGDDAEHDEGEETAVPNSAVTGCRHRTARQAGIETFQHHRPPDHRQHRQGQRGRPRHRQQRRVVDRQHAAEQQMRQIDPRCAEISATPAASATR